jgi:hypothetical protein
MFERFTEKARRVNICARYKASQFGSWEITTEHLLLALTGKIRLGFAVPASENEDDEA